MASELLAYLELFEGKLSLTEILTLDYALLIEMIKIKNAQIELKNKQAKENQMKMDAKMNSKNPKK